MSPSHRLRGSERARLSTALSCAALSPTCASERLTRADMPLMHRRSASSSDMPCSTKNARMYGNARPYVCFTQRSAVHGGMPSPSAMRDATRRISASVKGAVCRMFVRSRFLMET